MRIVHKVTLKTKASTKAIWKVWQNVEDWPGWDKELEWVTIDGPFIEGQTGKIKPKGSPVSSFKITTCVPFKQCTSVSKLPLTQLIFDHYVKFENGETLITHQILMKGPLSWLFNKLIGPKLKKGLDEAVRHLIQKAENSEGKKEYAL
ncbi:hypothetical protein DID75_04965 [Candidatus Marinamargulisbacteria bacterium SCGC AG-410-N11]|nr:hypothetical protein DID75_04965 [Candidatus Marinamargulisbacteria bacterium SCGC AG-410-N11]